MTLVHDVPSFGEMPVTSGGCRARDMAHGLDRERRRETVKDTERERDRQENNNHESYYYFNCMWDSYAHI